ncbi:hypothetical protein H5410_015226 [Solanum commersonii]|uniref:Uncharacterized protein n=1 Tax=Solanum commersonii TaxID=4109 RepID=A0A9J5ZTS1_SOLCO|nr:hypothetical protein H5410_015226 [Solanum commersonii]
MASRNTKVPQSNQQHSNINKYNSPDSYYKPNMGKLSRENKPDSLPIKMVYNAKQKILFPTGSTNVINYKSEQATSPYYYYVGGYCNYFFVDIYIKIKTTRLDYYRLEQ